MSDVTPSPSEELRTDTQRSYDHVSAWGLANAYNQKYQMEALAIEKMLGRIVATVPFGNTIQITVPNNPTPVPSPLPSGTPAESWLSKAAKAGALLLAAGAAGAGGVAAVNSFRAAPTPAANQAADKAQWIIDVEPVTDGK